MGSPEPSSRIVHPQPGRLRVMRLERVARKVLEAVVGGAEDVHGGGRYRAACLRTLKPTLAVPDWPPAAS